MHSPFQLVRMRDLLVCTLTLLCATNTSATLGQPGTLDPTWGTASPLGAGKVITKISSGHGYGRASAVQPDGKVILAGNCWNGSKNDFCAVRYHGGNAVGFPGGTLDLTFNVTGSVLAPISGGDDYARALALLPDGRIVLVGSCANGTTTVFCAARYGANGLLDTSFNGAGSLTTAITSGNNIAYAVALQPDGKIVLAGSCSSGLSTDFCAARYHQDGSLDLSFNGTGKVVTPSGIAYAIALQPDGKILITGNCGGQFCTFRHSSDGSLDISFNGTGSVRTSIGGIGDEAKAIVLQPDGKILLAGACWNGADYDLCALRYHGGSATGFPAGSVDTSFNGTGKVVTLLGSTSSSAAAISLQADGKAILAGTCRNGGPTYDFCALRYDDSGTLDLSFNGSGKVTTPVGSGIDFGSTIALQVDGNIVLAGSCEGSDASFAFCAIRYAGGPFGYTNCSLDIDGDNRVLATTDSLIHARIALGITGPAVVGGISFASHATRNTWPLIRDYLVTQCGMSLVQ